MPRGPRITHPGAVFHVINRFVDRHPFFRRDEDYEMFLETFFDESRNFSMLVFGYDLMPNHFHIVLQDANGEISHFLQRFLSRVACRLNQTRGRTGHLFQGRTKTLLVETDGYFEAVLGYVLLNRVRAGLAKSVFSDEWNSVGEMLTTGASHLARDVLWGYLFGHHTDSKIGSREVAECRQWLRSLDADTNRKRFERAHHGSFLGAEDFRRRVLHQLERRRSVKKSVYRRKLDRKCPIVFTHEAIRSACERATMSKKRPYGWKNTGKALEHMEWFLLYTEALWTLDRIRNECCERGVDHSRISMAIQSIRDSDVKTNAVTAARRYLYAAVGKTAKLQV